MFKTFLAVLTAPIISTIFSFTATATELPDFEKWPIHKTFSCEKRSDGNPNPVDFKMEDWQADKAGTQRIARITQISTGAIFIIYISKQEIAEAEAYFYNNRQLDAENFFKQLESSFSKDDFTMLITSCTGRFSIF